MVIALLRFVQCVRASRLLAEDAAWCAATALRHRYRLVWASWRRRIETNSGRRRLVAAVAGHHTLDARRLAARRAVCAYGPSIHAHRGMLQRWWDEARLMRLHNACARGVRRMTHARQLRRATSRWRDIMSAANLRKLSTTLSRMQSMGASFVTWRLYASESRHATDTREMADGYGLRISWLRWRRAQREARRQSATGLMRVADAWWRIHRLRRGGRRIAAAAAVHSQALRWRAAADEACSRINGRRWMLKLRDACERRSHSRKKRPS